MLFNSLDFVVFFPFVVGLYFLLPDRVRWMLLLVASYFFYMYWNPRYAVLILLSTTIDYFAAIQMGNAKRLPIRRMWLFVSLAGNLGLLFAFKYFGFFSGNIDRLLDAFAIPQRVPVFDILLPVGISFYTFQTLSYTIDVYRGDQQPTRHFGKFALYVSFFPQLVAGPIERSTRLLPQFFVKHSFNAERIRSGLLLMAWGFFKKLVIADRLAVYVAEVYNGDTEYTGLTILIATYAFTIQIFCDFSGYSDIAIGAARVLGYDLMRNFDRPYYSRSIAEHWRRWHISLSTWMRDYIYIPLGGSRVQVKRLYINLMITFIISGLWHGANWTFIIWGALHGGYIVVSMMTQDVRDRVAGTIGFSPKSRIRHVWQIVFTFHLIVFAFIIFRADNIDHAVSLMMRMATGFNLWDPMILEPLPVPEIVAALIGVFIMETVHLLQFRMSVSERLFAMPLLVRWAAYCGLVYTIIALGSFTSEQFIYFQF